MLLMTTLINHQCYQCVLDWGHFSSIGLRITVRFQPHSSIEPTSAIFVVSYSAYHIRYLTELNVAVTLLKCLYLFHCSASLKKTWLIIVTFKWKLTLVTLADLRKLKFCKEQQATLDFWKTSQRALRYRKEQILWYTWNAHKYVSTIWLIQSRWDLKGAQICKTVEFSLKSIILFV